MWSYHGTFAYMALRRKYNDQKQSFTGVPKNGYSYKFCEFHKKIPVLESLFDKLLRRLSTRFEPTTT